MSWKFWKKKKQSPEIKPMRLFDENGHEEHDPVMAMTLTLSMQTGRTIVAQRENEWVSFYAVHGDGERQFLRMDRMP